MSETQRASGPQFRADGNEALERMSTTIVGGRPPGTVKRPSNIPRGVEVLIRKATVDADFRQLLLETRGAAAETIGLQLDPAEVLMLKATPREQLAAIIERTIVPTEHRRAFLGTAAAAMLAAISVMTPGCAGSRPDDPSTEGIRPDMPATRGSQSDMPSESDDGDARDEPSADEDAADSLSSAIDENSASTDEPSSEPPISFGIRINR